MGCLRIIGVLIVLGLQCFVFSSECGHTAPCSFQGGDTLLQPDQLFTVGASQLEVVAADVQLEWLTVKRRVFKNSISPSGARLSGPTLRVNATDLSDAKTIIDVVNRLTGTDDCSSSGNLDCILLHLGGARVLHEGNDKGNVTYDKIAVPGENITLTYVWQSTPSWKTTVKGGTFLYRSFIRKGATEQADSGLCGILILDDIEQTADNNITIPQQLYQVSCPDYCEHDVQLLFQSTMQYASRTMPDITPFTEIVQSTGETLANWLRNVSNGIDFFTTNGQIRPVLDVKAGQVKRFRLANCGSSNTLRLGLSTSSCSIKEIAIDGFYLATPRDLKDGRSLLFPGSTVDWIIVCNAGGTFQLRSDPDVNDVYRTYVGILLTINVTGAASSVSLPFLTFHTDDFTPFCPAQIASIIVGPTNAINGKQFVSYEEYRATNSYVILHLLNTDPFNSHSLYFAQYPVQVLSYNKYTGPVSIQDTNLSWQQIYIDDEFQFRPCFSASFEIHCTSMTAIRNSNKSTTNQDLHSDVRSIITVPPLGNISVQILLFHTNSAVVEFGAGFLSERDGGAFLTYAYVPRSTCDNSILTLLSPPECGSTGQLTCRPVNDTSTSTPNTTVTTNGTASTNVTTDPNLTPIVVGSVVGVVLLLWIVAGVVAYALYRSNNGETRVEEQEGTPVALPNVALNKAHLLPPLPYTPPLPGGVMRTPDPGGSSQLVTPSHSAEATPTGRRHRKRRKRKVHPHQAGHIGLRKPVYSAMTPT